MSPEQEKTLADLKNTIPTIIEWKFRKGDAEHGGNLTDMPISEELQELTEELIDALIFVIDISKKIENIKAKWNHFDESLETTSTDNTQDTGPS